MKESKFKNIFVKGDKIYVYRNNKYHQLSQWVDNVGYYQVVFRQNGKRKYVRVHRLIAETLIPNPNNFPQVNHIDGNKLNNNINNLEWTTNAINTKHGYDNNLYRSKRRMHAIEVIHKTSDEHFVFKSIRECAEKLNLNRKTITSILKDNKNNHYPYYFKYKESVSTIPDECRGVDYEIGT